jgi:hypothetical protein
LKTTPTASGSTDLLRLCEKNIEKKNSNNGCCRGEFGKKLQMDFAV